MSAGTRNGGSCYNCHQMAAKEISYGTLGPSLQGFGKTRGSRRRDRRSTSTARSTTPRPTTPARRCRAWAFPGTLTEQQIKDLVAYLLDPASPVNQ